MNSALIFEHLTPTEAIRNHVEEQMKDLEKVLSVGEFPAVTLKQTNPKHFEAKIQLHIKGRELIASATGENLYKCVTQAKDKVLRQRRQIREKRVHDRKVS